MSQRLKVGVIGCGGIAQMMHLPFLADRPDLFEIEAVCDVNLAALEAVAARYHVPRHCQDYRDLLAVPLDAVLILAGDPHSPQVIAAAQQGRHIFVEKPLAFSLEEIDEVAAAVDKAGVQLMVAYMKRYDPSYGRARQLLAGRGGLRHALVTVWHPDDAAYRTHYNLTPLPVLYHPAPGDDELGATARVTKGALAERVAQALGDGAPIEQRVAYLQMCLSLVHQVNALRGLLGEPETVLSTNIWHDGRAMTSTLRFSPQLAATLTWIYLPGIKHYQEKYLFLAPELRLELEFPSPYLRHFPTGLRMEGMDGAAAWEKEIVVSYDEAFREELLHFHHCVVSGELPHTGLEDARRDTQLMIDMARAYRALGE